MSKRLHGLKPIINDKTEVLILGSFPGRESLEKKEYYANKRNQFWRIISDLFGNKRSLMSYKEKIDLLVKNKLGLWDIIESCYREGSSDSKITGEKLNDIKRFLREQSNVEAIFLNGRKAEKLFQRNHINSMHIKYLPSTSPANTVSYQDKKAKWQNNLGLYLDCLTKE